MDGWKVIKGDFTVESGEYSQRAKEDDCRAAYIKRTYSNVTIETVLRCVDKTPLVSAGVFFRRETEDETAGQSGYRVLLTSRNKGTSQTKIELYAGSELIAQSDVGEQPFIFKKLKIEANGDNIKVYFGNNAGPCIDINDGRYTNGYIGLEANKSHWHFRQVSAVEN